MMQGLLPGTCPMVANPSDVVMTPRDVALDIVDYFKPTGRILDPARGDGAFFDCMPGADWCEVRDGRDFFAWNEPVDWIVTNPPFGHYSEFLEHAFSVSSNVVFLASVYKPWCSPRLLWRIIPAYGGIRTLLQCAASPAAWGWKNTYPVGAIHYQRGYTGKTAIEFLGTASND